MCVYVCVCVCTCVCVSDLSQHTASDYRRAVDLLEEGIANRITAATHIHDASSRSHAIFTIQYTQVTPSPPHQSGLPSAGARAHDRG